VGRDASSPAYNLVQVCTAIRRRGVKCEDSCGDVGSWYALPTSLFTLWLLTIKQGTRVDDGEEGDAMLQEDLLAVLKVGSIFNCCIQPFSVAQSTVPSAPEGPLTVDLSNSESICMPALSDPLFLLIERPES